MVLTSSQLCSGSLSGPYRIALLQHQRTHSTPNSSSAVCSTTNLILTVSPCRAWGPLPARVGGGNPTHSCLAPESYSYNFSLEGGWGNSLCLEKKGALHIPSSVIISNQKIPPSRRCGNSACLRRGVNLPVPSSMAGYSDDFSPASSVERSHRSLSARSGRMTFSILSPLSICCGVKLL